MSAPLPPPTPAAVRAAIKNNDSKMTEEEKTAFYFGDPRFSREILLAHIHVVAAEMRHIAGSRREIPSTALAFLADKLEGKA